MSGSYLETILPKYFQKKIKISIGNDTVKHGQFILFENLLNHNNYYFELFIKRKDKIDSFKIPYPYKVEEYEDDMLLYLDYRHSALVNNDPVAMELIKCYIDNKPNERNKFLGNIVEIQFE